ncbi:MAG: orotidine-5'-phosphate decarboxylase [Candidatus Binatia bacterium]
MDPKNRIIFPLDCSTQEEAEFYVSLLQHHVGMFKVGLELFVSQGPNILRSITQESGAKVFLDLKFHDIPETVRKAQLAANAYGAEFVTVHCDQGRQLLRSVVDATLGPELEAPDLEPRPKTQGSGPRACKVLGVTLLTSLDRKNLDDLGMDQSLSVEELVLRRARLAKAAGCAGVVCSGREVQIVKEELGKDFLVVVPGIRPTWQKVMNDDQKRITTPTGAVKAGADYVVVGRPIRLADDPVKAALRVAEEIAGAAG